MTRALVVVEDDVIASLAAMPEAAAAYPFLSAAARPLRGCGGCGSYHRDRAAFAAARLGLARLDGTGRALVRRLLDAAAVRVVYQDESGNVRIENF